MRQRLISWGFGGLLPGLRGSLGGCQRNGRARRWAGYSWRVYGETGMEEAAFTLRLAEAGEVVAIMQDVRLVLGPRDVACEALCRFLTEVGYDGCG